MKRVAGSLLLVLLGVAVCFGLSAAVSFHRAVLLARSGPPPLAESVTKSEGDVHRLACELFARRDFGGLNRLLRVGEGDISLRMKGEYRVHEDNTPMAEVVLSNRTQHRIVLYQPSVSRLTPVSSRLQDSLLDHLAVTYSFSAQGRCQVVAPAGSVSFPVSLPTGLGRHRVNVTATVLTYEPPSGSNRGVESSGNVIARTDYTYEITRASDETGVGNATNQ